jgi:hypothetical protein
MWNGTCNKLKLNRRGGDNHVWYYNSVQPEPRKLIFLGLNMFVMNMRKYENVGVCTIC